MLRRIIFTVAAIIAVVVVGGLLLFYPGIMGTSDSEERNLALASALTKTAKAVESAVGYKSPPEGARDAELLEFATRHDPSLLTPFAGYTLRAEGQSKHGVVLVCTPGGGQAILEDVGCSAELDIHHWRAKTPPPCEFLLDAVQICGE